MSKTSNRLLVYAIFLFFTQLGCTKKGDIISPNKTFAADSITDQNVSYENYISPLLKKNCSTCHGNGGSAESWWLNTQSYENAVQYANPITNTIINGTMPPPPKFPFSDRDKMLLKAWIRRGLPSN